MAARRGRGTLASNRRCEEARTRGEMGRRRSSPPREAPAAIGVEGEAARRRFDGGGPSLVAAALCCRAQKQGEERRGKRMGKQGSSAAFVGRGREAERPTGRREGGARWPAVAAMVAASVTGKGGETEGKVAGGRGKCSTKH